MGAVREESSEASVRKRVKWRKILYEKQPFDDNYSGGDEFLKELRKNVSVVEYTFMEAVCGASRVMLHADAVVAYLLVFESLNSVPIVLSLSTAIVPVVAALIYLLYLYIERVPLTTIPDHLLTLLILLSFGYALTPVIRTLTETISTDTVYAMSMCLFLLSFIFHDYAMSAPMVSMVFSVNLSLAASVCLVSRVKSNDTAFALLALSMALFCYWPTLRNVLLSRYPLSSFLLLVLIAPLTLFFLFRFSAPLAVVHFIFHLLVVAVCPEILIRMQPYKRTIHGPWDEATL